MRMTDSNKAGRKITSIGMHGIVLMKDTQTWAHVISFTVGCLLPEQFRMSSFKSPLAHSNEGSGGHQPMWINNGTWRCVYGGIRIQWPWARSEEGMVHWCIQWNKEKTTVGGDSLMDYIFVTWMLQTVGSKTKTWGQFKYTPVWTERGDLGTYPIAKVDTHVNTVPGDGKWCKHWGHLNNE